MVYFFVFFLLRLVGCCSDNAANSKGVFIFLAQSKILDSSVTMVDCIGWLQSLIAAGNCSGWLQWLMTMVDCNHWLQWLIVMVDCSGLIAAFDCSGWLQWLMAMVDCSGCLQWLIAVVDCSGWLPWLIAVFDCNAWLQWLINCNGWLMQWLRGGPSVRNTMVGLNVIPALIVELVTMRLQTFHVSGR